MKRLATTTALTILLIAFARKEAECRRRSELPVTRRIVDKDAACDELEKRLTEKNGGRVPQYVELTDQEKMDLLRMKGRSFVGSLVGNSGRYTPPDENSFPPFQSNGRLTRESDDLEDLLSKARSGDEFRSILRKIRVELDVCGNLVTTIGKCWNRSTPFEPNSEYVRMCTTCHTTTKTPPDVWPSLFYGFVCSNDTACLYEDGTPQGKCHQTKIFVKLLIKSNTSCVHLRLEDDDMMARGWDVKQCEHSVGCECGVRRGPKFT